jgi:hypothetical protein
MYNIVNRLPVDIDNKIWQAHSHHIRGHVYIVDKNHLFIRKFSYDGGGSLDAYFWVGQRLPQIIDSFK